MLSASVLRAAHPGPRRAVLALMSALLFTQLPMHGSEGACACAPDDGLALMPEPASVVRAEGRLAIDGRFTVWLAPDADARERGAVERALKRLGGRLGLDLAGRRAASPEAATLAVFRGRPSLPIPALGEDESYVLTTGSGGARLDAPTTLGVLRGLETFLQLVRKDGAGGSAPAVRIEDRPRFPWRGLMIDVSRHWQPLDVIERNLDGMAMVKLNVLHLHLTDDQGFRIESRTHPELQGQGSDGHYFTQGQIREIIAYAADRGIRVVPEFDIPGHATSWLVSHPELASAPGPYRIERRWGIFDPVMDPTNEGVYRLLGDFLGEMAALFPDPYLHLGGDENNGVQWNANPRIQAFIREHKLGGNEGLHTYFNRRMIAILESHGKRLVGWDEILQPGLPTSSVIQSWRGTEALAEAARKGYSGLLSNGYYIDLMYPASQHYLADPLPAGSALSSAERARVLGGEATMWTEWVSPETIDSRIWPRTAAIAERLWSPASVRDVGSMYRRLGRMSALLGEVGLRHEAVHEAMLGHLGLAKLDAAGAGALRAFVDIVEPVKHYQRGECQPWMTQLQPLTLVADAARADSAPSRAFSCGVERLLFGAAEGRAAEGAKLDGVLENWIHVGRAMAGPVAGRLPELADAGLVGAALADASQAGREALASLASGKAADAAWAARRLAVLDKAAVHNGAAVEIPALRAIRYLVIAAREQAGRDALSPSAWRERVEKAVGAPPEQ